MKILTTTVIAAAALASANVWAAADAQRGKALHDKSCFGCHNVSMYTRPNSIIHSFPDLANRVKFCETQNGMSWNNDQVKDVAAYLNENFYKFKGK